MQGIIISCVFILTLVSPSICLTWNIGTENSSYNVMDFGARGDGISDDSQAILSAWNSTCGAEGAATLVIPPQKIFLVTNLILGGGRCNASSIHIQLQGKIVAPSKDAWKDPSYWIRIEYINNLTIDGDGRIDGTGSSWWPCKSCTRPRALSFHACNNLSVSHLKISNTPGAHIAINGCNGAKFSNMYINSPGYSPNTDGFDLSSSHNILIHNSVIRAGDDCIAINGGCSNINATGLFCGPGHGISVGSLGKNHANETVEEVYVHNCTFQGTSNGARIKTFPGGSGYARKIVYEKIKLINVSNPILIDQHYGDKNAAASSSASAVQVSEVTYRDFNGTSAREQAINLNCSSIGCHNLVLDKIYIVSDIPGKKTDAFCNNSYGTVDSTVPSLPCMSPN